MNKRELELLEKVFGAEIDGMLNKMPGLYQTKSKLAKKLVADGYLVEDREVLGGGIPVIIEGYRLTLLGNLTYCMSCDE